MDRRGARTRAFGPRWENDGAGRRVVEEKKFTLERIGAGVDGMDAVNLAYLSTEFQAPEPIAVNSPTVYERYVQERDEPRSYTPRRRGLFGQGR